MNVGKILVSLRQQRQQLNRAIAALESLDYTASNGGRQKVRARSPRKLSVRIAGPARTYGRVIPFIAPGRQTGTTGNTP